jgi:2-polyprenyl-3-methyl-5-hydroxy-6-metoxy-1,4-benzoquinol methylase
VTTINRTTASYLLAIVAAENVLGLVAKGTHTWDKFVTPDEIKLPLEKSKFNRLSALLLFTSTKLEIIHF